MLSAIRRGLGGITITITERLDTGVTSGRRRGHAWVLVPLAIFGISRVISWAIIASASTRQIELSESGYMGVIVSWDGDWYRSIAVDGYQVPAADDPDSARLLWMWAFPPLFPVTVRAVMGLTQTSFAVAASIVSLSAAAVGMVLLFRLLKESGGTFLAVCGVTLSSFFVSAPLFQAAYSEALAFLLLMAFFLLLRRRRYLWCIAVVSALALTRIITLPLVAVVAIHAWGRYRARQAEERPSRGEVAALVATAGACAAGTVAWLLVASLFIGAQNGLARTQSQRDFYLGWFSDSFNYWGLTGLVLVVLIVVVLLLFALSRFSSGWGPDLRTWSAAYPLYVLSISPVMPGTLRYLLLAPTIPLLVVGSPTRSTPSRIVVLAVAVAAFTVGQWWFVNDVIVVSTPNHRFAP